MTDVAAGVGEGLCLTQSRMSPYSAVHAMQVNSTATFACHTNASRVCWIYRRIFSGEDTVDVCRDRHDVKFIDRCSSSKTGDMHKLVIGNVRISDAGFYNCENCFNEVIATANLLVLGEN